MYFGSSESAVVQECFLGKCFSEIQKDMMLILRSLRERRSPREIEKAVSGSSCGGCYALHRLTSRSRNIS